MKKFTTKNQNATFIIGLNWLPLTLDKSTTGKINSISKLPNIASTPIQKKKK
jgi:hypothetical protein